MRHVVSAEHCFITTQREGKRKVSGNSNSDWDFVWVVGMVLATIILFAGEPDIIDAFIMTMLRP